MLRALARVDVAALERNAAMLARAAAPAALCAVVKADGAQARGRGDGGQPRAVALDRREIDPGQGPHHRGYSRVSASRTSTRVTTPTS